MSGSPKYSSYSLSYAQEQAIAAERARLAQIEQAQRAAEEQKRREERLRVAKAGLGHASARLRDQLAGLSRSELARFAGDSAPLVDRIVAVGAQVEACTDEGAVAGLQSELDRLRAQVARVEARARAGKLAADLAEEAGDAAEIEQLLGTVRPDLAERFDRAGAARAARGVRELTAAIQREDLSGARRLSSDARRAVETHIDIVERRHDDWTRRRDRALRTISAVADQVAAAQSDEVCRRWVGAPLAALAHELEPLHGVADSDHPDDVDVPCASASARLDELTARAQQLQLDEDRRQTMVTALIEVMDRMSFTLQRGTPAPEDAADPTSSVRIRARRGATRSTIDVSVGIDGAVAYVVDGFAMQVETADDGSPAATCDEAEAQIEALHDMLEREFGVHADGLRWNGQDPNRNLRTAKQLPSSNPARRTV